MKENRVDNGLSILEKWLPEEWVSFIIKIFVKSPIIVFSLAISYLQGYGLIYVLRYYRGLHIINKHDHLFHLSFGVMYSAIIFLFFNVDIIICDHYMKIDEIIKRMPMALLMSMSIGFLFIVGVGALRIIKKN